MHLNGPIPLYGKDVENFKRLSSEDAGPMLLKFHVEPPWGGGTAVILFLMSSPLKPFKQFSPDLTWGFQSNGY